ncbi:hypothetical protein AgCh_024665, partial [Apium graveolens]
MSETTLSNEVVEPMKKDESTDNQPSTEAKPESDEAADVEDDSAAMCCQCCVVGTTCVVCLPCEIVALVVRCLLLP